MSANKKYNFNIDEEDVVIGSDIREIPHSQIEHFHAHPFKIDQTRVEILAVDIEKNGLISAIIVRNIGIDKYEILSGHHRFEASKLAGFTNIRAEVLENVDGDEAKIIVTGANLYQRGISELLPSEKVKSISTYCICSNRRGKKIFEESEVFSRNVKKYNAREKTAEKFSLNRRTVDDCMNLCKLSDSLLEFLDSGELTWSAGIPISFLSTEEQELLLELLKYNRGNNKTFLSTSEAEEIKQLSKVDNLTKETVLNVLNKELYKSVTKSKISFKYSDFDEYFSDNMNEKEILSEIKKALDFQREFNNGKFPQQQVNVDGSITYVMQSMED